MKRKIKIKFDDFWHPNTTEAIKENSLYELLSKRFDLELTENPEFLIYSCFGNNFLKHRGVRIFYTGENVRPDFNECDYAFSFDFPITEKNYRLPLYKLYKEFDEIKNRAAGIESAIKGGRKFCNFLYSNERAEERTEFFHKLQEYKKVDSGGKVLNNIGQTVGDKAEFLRKYKFTIAFENASYPGYTTEKILEPLVVNSIPIYWGNPQVGKDFNSKCFINCHEYNSFDEVIERVVEIDNNDDLYERYLREPVFDNNTENEYVKEENILERFEVIFSNKNIVPIANKTDILEYYKRAIASKSRGLYRRLRIIGNLLKKLFYKVRSPRDFCNEVPPRMRALIYRYRSPKPIEIKGFFSQYGQDRYVAETLFKGKQNGVFVDIGANDGQKFSNTYHFEKELGWTGVAVEPLPDTYKKLCENRNCLTIQGCIADFEGETEFVAIEGYSEMLSGIADKHDKAHKQRIERELKEYGGSKKEIPVKCFVLKNILDDHSISRVDYLSLDTEGGEFEILKSIDFSSLQVGVISVENNYHSFSIRRMLAKFGFKLVAITGCDEIYQNKRLIR